MKTQVKKFDRSRFKANREGSLGRSNLSNSETKNWYFPKNKIDYRTEAISMEETKYKGEGKIVVVKTIILDAFYQQADSNMLYVWADLPVFLNLNSKWHAAIYKKLEKYIGNYCCAGNPDDAGEPVYLRGELYYSRYASYLCHKKIGVFMDDYSYFIKPVYGIPFIVGDEKQWF